MVGAPTVLFPPKVTRNIFPTEASTEMVAPSVKATKGEYTCLLNAAGPFTVNPVSIVVLERVAPVEKTAEPLPVSSLKEVFNCNDVMLLEAVP